MAEPRHNKGTLLYIIYGTSTNGQWWPIPKNMYNKKTNLCYGMFGAQLKYTKKKYVQELVEERWPLAAKTNNNDCTKR